MTRLTEQIAERIVAEHSFDTGPTGFVGATVELLPVALEPVDPPAGPVFERLWHGYLTGDHTGVLAVSTPMSPGLDVAVRHLAADLAVARRVLADYGLAPSERAIDTHRPPDDPEFLRTRTSMENDADAFRMRTGAVRVCLDAGDAGLGLRRRWEVARAVGPVLTAAFANSPLRHGRPTGWRSTRQALRLGIDTPLPPGDPRTAWTRYALDHPVAGTELSFRQALRDGCPLDNDDLWQHLDTLPSPLRARGLLELSMIDAQPGDGWRVALAVTTALIDDDRADDEALAATADLPADAWTRSARDALADPLIADATRRCFLAAYAALARQGADRHIRDDVAKYLERYVNRNRTPADDLLDALRTPT